MKTLDQVRRSPVKVVLSDGVEREIKFTLNTMADLEERYETVDEAFEVLKNGKMKDLRFFLYAAIVQEGAPLTEKQIGNLIDIQSIGAIMDAISAASSQDLPQESDVAGYVDATDVTGTKGEIPN